MVNDALIRFSKKFDIPVDSDEIISALIQEISTLRQEIKEG